MNKTPDVRSIPLDGLRAVAVLLVFVAHAIPFAGGHLGVDIFFVLSGFLITRILVKEFETYGRISLRDFYWRRGLRLFPALSLLLVFYLTFVLLFSSKVTEHLWAVLNSFYIMNWVRAFSWGPQGYLGHTWSLAIEEQFYFTWPISLIGVLCYRGSEALRSIIVGLIASVMIWRGYLLLSGSTLDRIYNGFDTHCDALLIGCLLATMTSALPLIARAWIPLSALVVVSFLIFGTDLRWLATGGFPLTACAAASVIAALVSPGNDYLKKFLSVKPVVVLGQISYGFYLWHYVFVVAVEKKVPTGLVLATICFPLTFVVAWLSFRYVEQPILKYKNIPIDIWRRKRSISA
jgi:peptidoglycan/LPS O-acetylase OafA/YrhL